MFIEQCQVEKSTSALEDLQEEPVYLIAYLILFDGLLKNQPQPCQVEKSTLALEDLQEEPVYVKINLRRGGPSGGTFLVILWCRCIRCEL